MPENDAAQNGEREFKSKEDSQAEGRERDGRNRYSPGKWFMFPKDFLKILTTDQALMLAAIISQSDFVQAGRRRRPWKGWFYFNINQVKEALQFDRQKQWRILSVLIKQGIVKRKLRGIPPKRYLKVCFRRIEQIVDDFDVES